MNKQNLKYFHISFRKMNYLSINLTKYVQDLYEGNYEILMREMKELNKSRESTLMSESKEELKSLLMRVKEESEKDGLKLSIIFLELSCRSCLYIFEISCLSVASFAIIFSHSEGCLFTLLIFSFVVQKLLILNQKNG